MGFLEVEGLETEQFFDFLAGFFVDFVCAYLPMLGESLVYLYGGVKKHQFLLAVLALELSYLGFYEFAQRTVLSA